MTRKDVKKKDYLNILLAKMYPSAFQRLKHNGKVTLWLNNCVNKSRSLT